MGVGLVHDLAEWAISLRRDGLPESAIHAARRLLIDRLGIGIGGHRLLGLHPAARTAMRWAGHPAATVWATGRASFAPYAALANGCAGDYLELAAGPECVEAGFAAAEVADATAGDLLVALAAAAEVAGYLRRWLSEAQERHGLHPPAGLGALSAVVASGRLLGLSADQLAGALASAAALGPQAPYGAFSGGASGKTLYGGWPQMLGLFACLWATDGMAGPATVLEGSRGIGQALLDAGGAVPPPPFRPAEGGWEIERVGFKPFACNRASHPALTVLSRLLQMERAVLEPADIESVQVWTYPYAVELDQRSRGDDPIAAQVSVRKSVALFLALGGLEPGSAYSRETLADPRVVELARRVSVELDPACAGPGPRVRGARVRVAMKGGRVLEDATSEPKWGPSHPATDEDLRQRFARLVGSGPEGAGIDLSVDLWALPEGAPIRSIIRRDTIQHG